MFETQTLQSPALSQAEGLAHTSPVAPPWVRVADLSVQ